MIINGIKDRVLILKESFKSNLLQSPLLKTFNPKYSFIKNLKLGNVRKIIDGKPNTIVIITDNKIIRMPLDKLSQARCRMNKTMLMKLSKTNFADYIPAYLNDIQSNGNVLYCEGRAKGMVLDIPVSNMEQLIIKAADFITRFHQSTVSNIIVDEPHYKRLFERAFSRLYPHIDNHYAAKLGSIEVVLKQQFLNKPFKTVWLHGDYKLENVLFNTKTWEISAIIDWDLSEQIGLPLLDILYLVSYKEGLMTKRSVTKILQERYLDLRFNPFEQRVINEYMDSIDLPRDVLSHMLVMFWLHHVGKRYAAQLVNNLTQKEEWMKENVYAIIDLINLNYLKGRE
jgi:hypothetical protein